MTLAARNVNSAAIQEALLISGDSCTVYGQGGFLSFNESFQVYTGVYSSPVVLQAFLWFLIVSPST